MKRKLLLCTAFLASCVSLMAQWYGDPVEHLQVLPDRTNVYDRTIRMTPNGNTWVAFNKPVTENSISVALQLVDPDGYNLFDEPIVVSNYPSKTWTAFGQFLYVDRDGNAIVAVVDQRNSPDGKYGAEGMENYTVYKVSQEGEMLWGKEGITLQGEEVYDLSCGMSITQIADGSYVMAWMHNRQPVDENDQAAYNMMSIEMQRVSAEGEMLWEAEDVRIYDEKIAYWYPYVIDGSNNQVILVYAKGSGQDLYARKLDFDGSTVWSEDTRIYNGGWGSIPLWSVLTVEPSGDGGVILSWNDDRFATNIESARLAYIKSNGENGFYEEGGIKLTYNELRCLSVVCKYHPESDSFYAFWREASAGQSWYRMVAQRISKEGELMWGETGIEIQPLEETTYGYPTIQCGDNDNMAFFYQRNYSYTFGDVGNFITVVNVEDTLLRETNEFTKDDVKSEKANLISTAMHNDEYWVTLWLDQGAAGDANRMERVMMQRINKDLTVGCPHGEEDDDEEQGGGNETMGQWGREASQNILLEEYDLEFNEQRAIMAPNGYTWYYTLRPNGSFYQAETLLQLIDSLGNPVFDDMLLVSDYPTRSWQLVNFPMMVDRDGNAIVAVHDIRHEPDSLQRLSYTIYKISQEGEFLWGEDGITIETNTSTSSHMTMTQIEDGSYVFAWEYADEYFIYSIRMQRVSADGELLWDTAELELTDTNTNPENRISYKYPTVIDAGYNQVLMSYFKGSNLDLYVRKIDFDGSSVWSEDTRVYRNGWSGAAPWNVVCVEPSGDGGMLLAWNDDRYSTGSQAYLSYVMPNGELGFAAGIDGQKLSYSELSATQVRCKYDPSSDSFVTLFREAYSASLFRVVAQRLTKDGELLWDEAGFEVVPLITSQCSDFDVEVGPEGKVALSFIHNEQTVGNAHCYMKLVNVNDTTDNQSIVFSDVNVPTSKSGLDLTRMYDGKYWVASWVEQTIPTAEYTPENPYAVRMHRINADLTLGCDIPESDDPENDDSSVSVVEQAAIFNAVSTIVDGQAAFAINMPAASQATLAIYDVNGSLVAQPHDGMLMAGKNFVVWNVNAPAGIYLATLTTNQGVQTIKLLVK